jgi:hypothetical protein
VERLPCTTSIGDCGVVSCFLLIVRFSREISPIMNENWVQGIFQLKYLYKTYQTI